MFSFVKMGTMHIGLKNTPLVAIKIRLICRIRHLPLHPFSNGLQESIEQAFSYFDNCSRNPTLAAILLVFAILLLQSIVDMHEAAYSQVSPRFLVHIACWHAQNRYGGNEQCRVASCD